MEIAVAGDHNQPALCWECKIACCDDFGENECKREDAYGDSSPDVKAFAERISGILK
jgi:hypothetical protein